MRYLLDTHAAIWAAEGDSQLGPSATEALKSASHGNVFISDITLLEISMLEKKGRFQSRISIQEYLTRLQGLYPPVRMSPSIAARAMDLPLPQGDPFDRVIVATASHDRLTLITRDASIAGSRIVPTLW